MNYRPAFLCFVTMITLNFAAVGGTALAGPADWLNPGGGKGTGDADLDMAKSDYMLNCASCHGENGDGNGQLAESLSAHPRNHRDAEYLSKRTDEQLFKAISEGGAAVGRAEDMPPHNTILSKEKIRALVKYIRHLCNCKYEGK